MLYRTIAVDPQVYDIIRKTQEQSGASTVSDAVRLMLGLTPVGKRRTRAHTIAAVKTVLADHPGSTAAEVAQAIDLSYATTTTILARLEKAGHVEREPAPSRRHGPITHLWRLRAPSGAPDAGTVGLRALVTEFWQQAADEAAEARDELAALLDEGHDDLAEAMATVLYRQHYARWWNTVIEHIRVNVLDPAAALKTNRDNAHQALLGLDTRTPCGHCPYTRDPALIIRAAISDFCRDTEPSTLQARRGTPPPGASQT